jgi:hypothetical protein
MFVMIYVLGLDGKREGQSATSLPTLACEWMREIKAI